MSYYSNDFDGKKNNNLTIFYNNFAFNLGGHATKKFGL